MTRRPQERWIIDFDERDLPTSALFEKPFQHTKHNVLPLRKDQREPRQKQFWWLLARPCAEMKNAANVLDRFLVTPTVCKHRVFVWLVSPTQPDHQLYVFARNDDFFFGVLHARLHELWALRLGTRLETRPRYTPSNGGVKPVLCQVDILAGFRKLPKSARQPGGSHNQAAAPWRPSIQQDTAQ